MRISSLAALALVCGWPWFTAAQGTRAWPMGRFEDGLLAIDVVNERHALWYALRALSGLCACAVSYEEPEWRWSGDVEAVEPQPPARPVLAVRATSLHVTERLDGPLTADWVLRIIGALLAQQTATGLSAEYDVVPGPPIEVRARRVKDADGRVVPVASLLDRPISLHAGTATVHEWWQRIGRALREASGRNVTAMLPAGNVPLELARMRVPFGAVDEPARIVLNRLVLALPRHVSWSMEHTPALDQFTLGLWIGPKK